MAILLRTAQNIFRFICIVYKLTSYVTKTKALISCVVTTELIWAIVFAYAKRGFSRDMAHVHLNSSVVLRSKSIHISVHQF